jgi:hypothetical protein
VRRFIIEQSDADFVSHSGLALVGMALNRHSGLPKAVDRKVGLRHGISHSDVLRSYIGLLSLGKSDFEAVENVRDDRFFAEALGITTVPSAVTLRQRLDERAGAFLPVVEEASVEFLRSVDVKPTALETGHVPLDADVTPFDNANTVKEGVSRTYKGHDGYAPMAAYLGREGYCLEFELREGKQHCQRGTPAFLTRVLERARKLTNAPLLLRLDGGNDALENIDVVLAHNESDEVGVDFLIKWNPRKEDACEWLDYAEEHARFTEPRPGKRVAVFDYQVTRYRKGYEYRLRRVMRVIERSIDNKGQALLVPEIEIEGWWTSLELVAKKIIALYADHGTSEQFHSEFKTDLDIERLPSGKFATNALVLSCAALAYNILRWLGQTGLTGPGGPVRHSAKRRRIRTVMQELMYLAARFIETGRRLKLAFARRCVAVGVFCKLYHRLAYG